MKTIQWVVKKVYQSMHVVFRFADLTKNHAMLDSVYTITFLPRQVFQPTQTDWLRGSSGRPRQAS
jgi:hypothetical protein